MNTQNLSDIRIRLAVGEADFPMKKGSFRYIDRVLERALTKTSPDGTLLLKDGAPAGCLSVRPGNAGEEVLTLALSNPRWNRIYLTLPAGKDEHFYGGGETFSEFDLQGQKIRIWVAEHQNADRISRKLSREKKYGRDPSYRLPFDRYESYYAQPTIVSSAGYYIHIDTTAYVSFDFRHPGKIVIEMRENAPVIIGRAEGKDRFRVLSGMLADRLGHVPALPEWAGSGMILGIQRGTEEIDRILADMKRHRVPVAGIWSQDWCGCRRTGFGYQVMWNWAYDPSLYPSLPEKIASWKQQGVRFLGYINPFLAIEKELYRIAASRGYCVKNQDGGDYLVTITTFPAAMIDLTNPAAWEWYKGIIKDNMIGIGMDGWMADFGEYLPADAVLCDGDPQLLHNAWPCLWAKLNREAIEEAGKRDEVFFFTRAGSAATIRWSTLMWNGDQHVDWSLDDGLASVIPASLSLAMSGYPVVHSDAGGYTTMEHMVRSRELLMRWEEMNIFSPFMRSHEGNQPARNVQTYTDGEQMEHLGRCVRLHAAIAPYLRALLQQAEEDGIPVMRPLFYHYDEPQAYTECYEYLLGPDVLVAPVITEGAAERTCWLPSDGWIHIFTGTRFCKGTVTVAAPIGSPPVFVRASSPYCSLLLDAAHRYNYGQ